MSDDPNERPGPMASRVLLTSWHSRERHDYYTTSLPAWHARSQDDSRDPDYTVVGSQGLVFDPGSPAPANTVALYAWWSPGRGDNFLTSDPKWKPRGSGVGPPDYSFVRIEGYVYDPQRGPPPQTVPLMSWWNPDVEDNAAMIAWGDSLGAKHNGYTSYRIEGYVMRDMKD